MTKYFLLVVAVLAFFTEVFSQEINHCQHFKNLSLQKNSSGMELRALNSRSDTFDILKYTINLDITDFTAKKIKGNCVIKFTPRITSVNYLPLDLLKLSVDSISYQGSLLTYTYNDTLLTINFVSPINTGDTIEVTVYYQGTPQGDPSGWGGFYFMSGYAFNLGVGFDANPHNYGRVWFPCFDNFIERSQYEFNILTSGGKKAFCNGELISETIAGTDSVIRKWVLNEEIPTYLASVAVANYTSVEYTHNGTNGPIPVVLAAIASDTINLKNSFLNLGGAIDAFESSYGPHAWNKVGFSLVPFSSGAMEHPTNIAYPLATINGALTYETLMAHELAHHWWGDLATCETAEDMWINEGWASYSEHLFTEKIYGEDAYIYAVAKNSDEVLQYAHIEENGFRAVSGIPHNLTYGDHVYKKGASVAHSLRGYLSDQLFFQGISDFFDSIRFTHVSSEKMRDVLSFVTSYNLNSFFENWVFNGGFTHFSVDSFSTSQSGSNYNTTVHIRQRLKGTNNLYSNVPILISFYDAQMNLFEEKRTLSGQLSIENFTLPFNPEYIGINLDYGLTQAVSFNKKMIKTTGFHELNLGRVRLEVSSVPDSAFVVAEHHWIQPDDFWQSYPGVKISTQRYWKVDGIWPEEFNSKIRFIYDGRITTSNGNGYLDNELLGPTKDSIILLYRESPKDEWYECSSYTVNNVGSQSQKYGNIVVDTLRRGEYALAWGNRNALGIKSEREKKSYDFSIFPNPSSDYITINSPEENFYVGIFDFTGKEIYHDKAANGSINIKVEEFPKGLYIVKITTNSSESRSKKLIINK